MIHTLLLGPSLQFATLVDTSLFSHLNFTQLHFTTFSFGLTPFKFPTASFHLTSLHHCTFMAASSVTGFSVALEFTPYDDGGVFLLLFHSVSRADHAIPQPDMKFSDCHY